MPQRPWPSVALPGNKDMTAVQRSYKGSYIVETDPHRLAAELDRLRQQVELTWPKEHALLARLVPAAPADILDLGCGPGYFTERLAEAYPNASIVGMDRSGVLLDHARDRLRDRFGNRVMFAERSLQDAGTEQLFDLVVCRYVLQHLEQPQDAVRIIHQMLKPGGQAVLIDIDGDLLGLSDPWNGQLASIYRRAGMKQQRLGGTRAIGRYLYRFLDRAGFSDVRLETILVHSDETDIAQFDHQINPEILTAALSEGTISPAEHAFACNEYERFLNVPSPLILLFSFMAVGMRV
jgi:ubiquinone/menaquinone biosynthesis C-methylase UbiE